MAKISNIKDIFLTKRFFQSLSVLIVLYVGGHFSDAVWMIARLGFWSFVGLSLLDLLWLFSGHLSATREVSERLSNGDENPVQYAIINSYKTKVKVWCIDEFPVQWQIRKAVAERVLQAQEQSQISIKIRPTERGWYSFGKVRLMAATSLGIFKRRFSTAESFDAKVYPSFMQLKKTELYAFSPMRNQQVSKKVQRPGNSREFEHIKEYTFGDDYRRLNWKATARQNKLMVNQYQEERSRQVIQLIDMGRTMKAPFNGLTLLDYAINASLALSNVILKKLDKVGLVTYSSKVHSIVKADNRTAHLNKMLETLFAQETLFNESNLEQVLSVLQNSTEGRSLLVFYSNFESTAGLERQLPLLKKLARIHVVLLVTFIDTDLEEITGAQAESTVDIYRKTLAEEHLIQKEQLLSTLNHFGIIHIKVRPEELSLAVIDKYLEVKERGVL